VTDVPKEPDSKVIQFPKAPSRLRPEMQVRWLLSNVDKIEDLAFVVRFKDSNPMTSASDKTNPYFLTMASMLLNEMAAARLDLKLKGPDK
jgi:hypothetical protein